MDPDLQSSRYRFRFFLANEGVQLVHSSLFDLGWQGCLRQFGCVLADPISDTLWVDLEYSPNRAVTATFHIHENCQQAGLFRVAVLGWFGRVHAIAFTTTITLAPRWIEACFVLFPVCLASWTVHNAYSIMFSLLGTLGLSIGFSSKLRAV